MIDGLLRYGTAGYGTIRFAKNSDNNGLLTLHGQSDGLGIRLTLTSQCRPNKGHDVYLAKSVLSHLFSISNGVVSGPALCSDTNENEKTFLKKRGLLITYI